MTKTELPHTQVLSFKSNPFSSWSTEKARQAPCQETAALRQPKQEDGMPEVSLNYTEDQFKKYSKSQKSQCFFLKSTIQKGLFWCSASKLANGNFQKILNYVRLTFAEIRKSFTFVLVGLKVTLFW